MVGFEISYIWFFHRKNAEKYLFFVSKNALEDNDELDASVKPLHTPFLTFLHTASLQHEVWEEKSLLLLLGLDSSPIPPSLAVWTAS